MLNPRLAISTEPRPIASAAWVLVALLASRSASTTSRSASTTSRSASTASRQDRDCSLSQTVWQGRPQAPDYIESLSLAQTGSYFLAYGQAVRWDLVFDVEAIGDATVRVSNFVDAELGELAWPPRESRYRIDRGEFAVGPMRFRCRLALSEWLDERSVVLFGERVR